MFDYIDCTAEEIKEFKRKYQLDYHIFDCSELYKVFSFEINDFVAIIQFGTYLSCPYISWFETFERGKGCGSNIIRHFQSLPGVTEVFCKPSDYETEKFWYKCDFRYDNNLSMFKWSKELANEAINVNKDL